MIDSILTSIKKLLGIEEEYTIFDEDILIHINTQFSVLHQMGASPAEPIIIEDKTSLWSEYFGDVTQAHMVKTYVYYQVRLAFDPPATSFAIDSIKKQADELAWRLSILEFVFVPPPVVIVEE